ncbi:MAG: hypothetical protein R6W67_12870 [Bacteroidales bacterium]
MKRTRFLFLFSLFFSLAMLSSAQEKEDYRMGTLWLKNSQSLEGYIWTAAGMSDRLDYIFYKPELNDLADKYYADDIAQFEIWQGSRRFYSILLPAGSGKVRKIAELHFKGEYSLYSAFEGLDKVFFLADASGNIARLENTVGNIEEEEDVSGNFNYEYREYLAATLSDLPGVDHLTDNIRYYRKDLSKLLAEYHTNKKLFYVSYPVPWADWHISAGLGAGLFRNMTRVSSTDESFFSPLSTMNLSFEMVSHAGRPFARLGFARYGGILFRDFVYENVASNSTVFYEERTSLSLISFSCLFGLNLSEVGRFIPYVAAGAEYNTYLNYTNRVMMETLYNEYNVIITDWNEFVNIPGNFPAIVAEAGTNFSLAPRMYMRAGASYGHFFDKTELMKSRINMTVSFVYKLF